MLDGFERIGGQRAREVAARFWMTPSEETALEYDTVCTPLYSRRDPFLRSPRRIWMNIRLMFHYARHIAPHIDITASLAAIACPTLVLVPRRRGRSNLSAGDVRSDRVGDVT